MKMIDFVENERIHDRVYLGNAGMKRAYLHEGIVWMVKFPQSTRNLEGKHLPSYTSSPQSEYIGSQIYASLGIPVHETVLGRCKGKIVVGCRDFALDAKLLEFHGIKNTVDEELISGSFGSSARGERLSDVLRVIENADSSELIEQDALKGMSFFTDDEDRHIHPFDYIASMENEDCNAAVLRFAERLDMKKVKDIVEGIPETAFGLPVLLPSQKEFDIRLLETAWEKGIRPVAEKLKPAEFYA